MPQFVPQFAIITSFLGAIRNRYISYRDERSLEGKLSLAASVDNIAGVELCYPQDFGDPELLKGLLRQHQTGCFGDQLPFPPDRTMDARLLQLASGE